MLVVYARYKLASYCTVAALARTGDAAAGPAILLAVAAGGGSPVRGAGLVAALTLMAAVGGPVTGALADRAARPRAVYIPAVAVMAGALGVIAVGAARWPLAPLLAAGLLAGAGQPLYTGGWTSLLAGLVPAGLLPRAHALDALTYDVAGVAGPALAAACLAAGPAAPVAAAAAALAAAGVALAVLPFPAGGGSRRAGRLREDLAAGMHTIAARPALRRLTVLSTLQLAGEAGRTIGALALAARHPGGTALAGVLLTASAVASLAGSVALARWPLRWPPERTALLATAAGAAALVALAAGGPLWLAATLFATGGAADPALLTSVFAVRSRESPPHLRAQVFATAASLKTSAYALALAACGPLAAHGAPDCFLAGATVQVAGLAYAVRSLRGSRQARDGLRAAPPPGPRGRTPGRRAG